MTSPVQNSSDHASREQPNPPSSSFLPPSYFRTSFQVRKPVRRATLYATALGIFDVHLNGRRVSDDWFNPGWTDYTKRVYYRAYDVTDQVRPGTTPWARSSPTAGTAAMSASARSATITASTRASRVSCTSSSPTAATEDIVTGPDWKAATGPILEADFLMGETYDAREAMPGWDAPGFDDHGWDPVDHRRRAESGGPVASRARRCAPSPSSSRRRSPSRSPAFRCSTWARTSPAWRG